MRLAHAERSEVKESGHFRMRLVCATLSLLPFPLSLQFFFAALVV